MNKNKVLNDQEIIPGQVSIAEYIEAPKEKIKPLEAYSEPIFTLDQLNVYRKLKEEYSLLRVLLYCCGTIGIEVNEGNQIVTHYVFRDGEEFNHIGRSGVLPMDKIVYYSGFEIKNTDIQLKRLHDLVHSESNKIKRVIQRKGDFNILIEEIDKALSVLPNGWVLFFTSINSIWLCNGKFITLYENL